MLQLRRYTETKELVSAWRGTIFARLISGLVLSISYSVMISTKLLCGSANIISSMYSTTCICHDHRQLQADNGDRPPEMPHTATIRNIFCAS
jgi:hypothetical protein